MTMLPVSSGGHWRTNDVDVYADIGWTVSDDVDCRVAILHTLARVAAVLPTTMRSIGGCATRKRIGGSKRRARCADGATACCLSHTRRNQHSGSTANGKVANCRNIGSRGMKVRGAGRVRIDAHRRAVWPPPAFPVTNEERRRSSSNDKEDGQDNGERVYTRAARLLVADDCRLRTRWHSILRCFRWKRNTGTGTR